MLKGISVNLINLIDSGQKDDFNRPIKTEKSFVVENVIVSPSTNDDVINSLNLYGKKSIYTLGIPKGDNHNWEDSYVEFFGKRYRTFGPIIEGIEDMVPLDWHKKIMVEKYE